MHQAWRQLTLAMLVAVMFIGVITFSARNFIFDNEMISLTETLDATVISNRDDSARVTPGVFYLNKENFEKEFKDKILGQSIYKNKKVTIDFDYLNEPLGYGIKGVRVFVKSDDKIDQATYILSSPRKD